MITRIKELKNLPKRFITSDGRILSTVGKRKWLKTGIQNSGYELITIQHQNKSHTLTIHRLVAIYFIDNPKNKPEVNHKDLNKLNNNISNLEWCTRQENQQHLMDNGYIPTYQHLEKYRHDKHTDKTKLKLSKKKIKLSLDDAVKIRKETLLEPIKYKYLRNEYNVSTSTIQKCRDNTFKCYDLINKKYI